MQSTVYRPSSSAQPNCVTTIPYPEFLQCMLGSGVLGGFPMHKSPSFFLPQPHRRVDRILVEGKGCRQSLKASVASHALSPASRNIDYRSFFRSHPTRRRGLNVRCICSLQMLHVAAITAAVLPPQRPGRLDGMAIHASTSHLNPKSIRNCLLTKISRIGMRSMDCSQFP